MKLSWETAREETEINVVRERRKDGGWEADPNLEKKHNMHCVSDYLKDA